MRPMFPLLNAFGWDSFIISDEVCWTIQATAHSKSFTRVLLFIFSIDGVLLTRKMLSMVFFPHCIYSYILHPPAYE